MNDEEELKPLEALVLLALSGGEETTLEELCFELETAPVAEDGASDMKRRGH